MTSSSDSPSHRAAALRKEYRRSVLMENGAASDPFVQFESWLNEAIEAEVAEPNAMVLSTVSEVGQPSSRVVLLKAWMREGFQFYSNYESQKGKELQNNPKASLLFYWPDLERQVRIEGVVTRVSREQNERYFASRPRSARLGAHASPQSSFIKNRKILEERFRDADNRYRYQEVPCPSQWGGYLLSPELYEFWQGREDRLHDRIVYTASTTGWTRARKAP